MRTISAVRPRVSQRAANQPQHAARQRFTPRRLAAAMAASSLLTLSLAPAVAQVPAQAPVLPTGLSVGAGQAQAVTNGNRMTVTNSSQAILNWNSFSIGAGNAVYFQQPGVTSQVLNRVTGNDPSLILGSLGSNGRVWLLNQNGVLFGQNARVDVAGLVASTLRLNDSDWLAGRYRFTEGSNAQASVLNQGEMRTSFGGSLALVSGSVGNEGLMQSPGGQVILAAGQSVELVDTGAAYLSVRITAPEGQARNLGVLEAAGGRIDIHAAAVNQQGIVRADALTSGPGGEVWIKASDSITLAAGSRTSADGAGTGGNGGSSNGGSITLQADTGRTTVQGVVSAVATLGTGGQAVLLGREVSVQDAARVDVSGSLGGGTVVVGGGTHGQDLRYTNAQAVYFGPQASIVADATGQGNGGDIVLWSDASTRAYGTLMARGGVLGGDGGHIETSGGWLDAQPLHVDTSAPLGRTGEWLLDPYNITISNSAFTSGVTGGPSFTSNGANAAINQSTINAALVNSNVTIYTGGNNGGSEAGNITITNAVITSNAAAPRSITFTADRAITMTGSTIQSSNGALTVQMQSAQTAGGGIGLNGATIVTGSGNNWGDIVFTGAASGQRPDGTAFTGAGGNVGYGIELAFSTLNAGSASVTLSGTSSNTGGTGVSLIATTLTAASVAMTGDAPIGDGVRLSNTTVVQATQTATLLGRGLAQGVYLVDDAQLSVLPPVTDTTASLLIDGISRTPTGGSGVLIETNGSAGSAVLTGRGASLVIRGRSDGATNDEAVRITAATSAGGAIIDASGGNTGEPGSSMLIQATGNGRNVQIDNALVIGPAGATQLQAPGTVTVTSNGTLVMLGNTTFAAGNIVLSGGADLHSETSAAVTLALNAQTDIAMSNMSVGSFAGPVSMSLLAGLSGAGTVTLADSTMDGGQVGERGQRNLGRGGGQTQASLTPQANANFGDIVIGGALPGTTPTGGSFTGAGGAGGSGVVLTNTTVDAGTANVSIAGVATASGGVGVSITDTYVHGASVAITGDAATGSGVVLQGTTFVAGDHDAAIRGRGLNLGVDIRDSAGVGVNPIQFDPSANGLIQGRALDTAGVGVRITTSGAGYAVEAGAGASMVIEAASASSGAALLLGGVQGSNAPLVDASGGGALILRTFDNGRQVQVGSADIVGGDGPVTLQAASEVNLTSTNLASNGAVSLTAPRVQLLNNGVITSQAAGTSILVSGSNAALTYFNNTAGSGVLDTPNGRWVVYGTNINDSANFNPGGLNYAFVRHNAAFGDWSQDSGNGLVFSAPQTAVYTGSIATRAYNATVATTLSNGSILSTSVQGDIGTLSNSNAAFASANAGVNIPVTLTATTPFTFTDSNGRPVYGYTLSYSNNGVPSTLSGTISKAQLTANVQAASKVYDATTSAAITVGAVSGFIGSETVAVGGSGNFADKNVGSNKAVTATYQLANGSNGGLAANYQFASSNAPTATITQRPLAVGGVTANTKVYDATTAATLGGTAGVTALAGDSVTVGGTVVANFNNKNVGTAKPVTVTGYTLAGADAANYSIVQPTGLAANITPRSYVVGGLTAADKVYDATTAATVTGTASGTALGGDNVTVSGTAVGSFADKNVGTGKAVTLTGLSLSGTDAANYSLVPPGLTASITRRSVLLTGVTANNKVYDATTVATLSGTAAVAALSGDVLTVGGSANASFANKNVGTGKPVTVTGYTLGGADAGNYSLVQPTGLAANITPRPLAIAGLTAADKVYDATTAATLVGTAGVTGLSGDAVSLGGSGLATFNDKNVGTAKPVGVSGFTLAGADAANYSLLTLNLSASITPRAVSVNGLSFNDKVYDASTTATVSGTAAVAALSGDVLSLAGAAVANFSDKNVGANKPVTVTGYTLAGADAGNYSIVQPAGQASITPRTLAITGISANDKVYDATTAATLSGTAAISALAGDSVVLGGAVQATFNNKNVGTAKPVGVTGFALSGADAGNYTLAPLLGLSASITPLQLSVSGLSVASKVYDGTTVATLAGTATVAALAGDAVSVTGTPSASYDNKNVGNGKPVVVTGFSLVGADAGNYTLAGLPPIPVDPGGGLQLPAAAVLLLNGDITPRPLLVNGVSANGKVYDGTAAATLSGSAAVSAIAGDAVLLSGTPAAVFTNRNAGTARPVLVTGYAISGADAGNYSLLQPQGLNATITPAALTYVADPAVRSVGQTLVDLTGSVIGFVGTETLATATSGALLFTTPATPSSPAGNYPIVGGGLVATNYSFGQAAANAQALSVVDLSPTTTTIVGSVAPEVSSSIAAILAAPRVGADSGLANLTASVSLGADPGTQPVGDFKAVRLSSLSTADIQGLLAGRDMFKRALLADSVQRLQDNPRLADLRECQTIADAQAGSCLITDRVKALVAQQPPAPAEPATPATPATPTTPPPGAATPPTVAATPAPGTATTAPATPTTPALPPTTAPLVATAPAVPPRAPAPAVDGNVDPLLREVQLIRRRVLTASLPQIERKVALVIGVDNYNDKSIPALGNAVRDARAVAQLFESKLGYEAVVLPNASKATLVGALNKLALTLGPRDSVVIYYAGHGQLVESTQLGYWLLADSGAKEPESWLSNTDISRLIGQIGASQVALISDSCYSGSLVSEERIRAAPTALDPKAVLARKSVVIMSSGGNEPVFDEGRDGHSPFAWNLMNTLNKVSEWQPGGNVFERVRFAVARELPQRPQYSASRAAGHQAGGDYLFEQRELAGGK